VSRKSLVFTIFALTLCVAERYWYRHLILQRMGLLFVLAATVSALELGAQAVPWDAVLRQPAAWYGRADATAIADIVRQHQRPSGGWPKDTDMTKPPDPAVVRAAALRPDATIDNGATITQMRLLARVFAATREDRFRDAFLRGLDYLLAAQYPNGGWPQFFPLRADYSRHVTFNDGAMVGVLTLLTEASAGRAPFDFADPLRREKARQAVGKGVAVILRAQIRSGGTLTAWCAQHDEVTLEPRGARTYEHPSTSGQESVGIVRFLMGRDSPDASLINAVDAAVAWLRSVRIEGLRLERRADPTVAGGVDVVVVADPSAPPLWARFYEIGTNRPMFSGRDGVVRYKLADIELERRLGYAWLGSWPQTLIEKEYPAWRKTLRDADFSTGRGSDGSH
jgi:PelA/Pel-15E family pectate lyase